MVKLQYFSWDLSVDILSVGIRLTKYMKIRCMELKMDFWGQMAQRVVSKGFHDAFLGHFDPKHIIHPKMQKNDPKRTFGAKR